jgi:hypothetical protein
MKAGEAILTHILMRQENMAIRTKSGPTQAPTSAEKSQLKLAATGVREHLQLELAGIYFSINSANVAPLVLVSWALELF